MLYYNPPEYDIASLYIVSFHCFVTKACVRRPGAAASVELRRRERRTLLAGAAGELAGATRAQQARPSSACTFSVLKPVLHLAPRPPHALAAVGILAVVSMFL